MAKDKSNLEVDQETFTDAEVEDTYHYLWDNDRQLELWDLSLKNELLVSKNKYLTYVGWGMLWFNIFVLIGLYYFLKHKKQERAHLGAPYWIKTFIKK